MCSARLWSPDDNEPLPRASATPSRPAPSRRSRPASRAASPESARLRPAAGGGNPTIPSVALRGRLHADRALPLRRESGVRVIAGAIGRDAEGRQVMATLGPEADGWTCRKAERALGEARRRRWRDAEAARRTFADLAEEFENVVLPAKSRSQLTRYARKALTRAKVEEAFRPWHGLRHTALTETAAAGVPAMFVQAKAGHAQGSTTERYLHATKTSYPIPPSSPRPGCSDPRGRNRVENCLVWRQRETTKPCHAGLFLLPGLDSNQQPSG